MKLSLNNEKPKIAEYAVLGFRDIKGGIRFFSSLRPCCEPEKQLWNAGGVTRGSVAIYSAGLGPLVAFRGFKQVEAAMVDRYTCFARKLTTSNPKSTHKFSLYGKTKKESHAEFILQPSF